MRQKILIRERDLNERRFGISLSILESNEIESKFNGISSSGESFSNTVNSFVSERLLGRAFLSNLDFDGGNLFRQITRRAYKKGEDAV